MSRRLAGPPALSPEPPDAVRRLAGSEPIRAVWENERGGVTFELGAGSSRRFVKWAPAESGLDLDAEVERLQWASAFITVPRVLAQGANGSGAWFVSAALRGESAVSAHSKRNPARTVAALGRGLRALHDALPVGECPFSWSAAERARHAGRDPREFDIPVVDRLVVCHADACSPNTLLDERGRVTGYVDLGRLGVADRWADLAIATWSTEWNYGPGFQELLLESYGVAPDPLRTGFYRRLWDLEP